MGKRSKCSSVDRTTEHWNGGTLVTVTVNERYPISSEALMQPGFSIILLNMTFGLLPITISGSRIKYFRCSVSQLYSFVFGGCIIVLSVIFVPQQLVIKFQNDGQGAGTGLILTGLVSMGHVLGFFLLKVRGHWLAKCFPTFWAQLTKLLQKSVIDVYGVEYKQMQLIRNFVRHALVVYFFLVVTYEVLVYFTDTKYIIHLFIFFDDVAQMREPIWYGVVLFGYLMWGMCNLSHILVSMLLCFIIRCITVSLRGINDQLQEAVGKYAVKSTIAVIDKEEIELRMTKVEEKRMEEKFDTFTTCYSLCQELTGGLSKAWGISIVLEVIVGVINLLGQFYIVLQGLYSGQGALVYMNTHVNEIVQAIMLGITHFYFLFQLSCYATEMVEETKLPLIILNLASNRCWPVHIQNKIQMFKMDIANTSISLSAANYFQVNKYLVTSVCGAITTYLIVLLQFTQTEAMKPSYPCYNNTNELNAV